MSGDYEDWDQDELLDGAASMRRFGASGRRQKVSAPLPGNPVHAQLDAILRDSELLGHDIIGDVHGCARALETLIQRLGYRKQNGIYRYPGRKIVFVGDIIDRGPRIREALHLVRSMVDAGEAGIVMGNHEYNAICFCTRSRPGSLHPYLREHTRRNTALLGQTLSQFEDYPAEWNSFLEWFREMPLFLDLGRFRVVHACWDTRLIERFRQKFPDGRMDEDFLHASSVRESFAGRVLDRLLRGTDLPLPDGRTIVSKDNFERSIFRTCFWSQNPQTYGDVVFQPDGLPDDLIDRPLSAYERRQILSYSLEEPPVFVGHYWRAGTPRPLTTNVACLDYSAVKYGKLVAYRYDGEAALSKDRFVWVDVEPGMPAP